MKFTLFTTMKHKNNDGVIISQYWRLTGFTKISAWQTLCTPFFYNAVSFDMEQLKI